MTVAGEGGLRVLGLAAAAILVASPANAHTVGLSQSHWALSVDGLSARVQLSQLDALELGELDRNGNRRIDGGELDEGRRRLGEGLLGGLRVTSAGRLCVGELTGASLDDDGVVLDLGYVGCPAEGGLVIELDGLLGRLPSGHRHAVAIESAAGTDEALLSAETPRFEPRAGASAPVSAGASRSSWRLALDYGLLGVEHILIGLDHVVFLLGLLLLPARARDVLAMVTAFTVSHSITLALAILGVLAPSPALVEPLIALSVAYVGLENLLARDVRARWRITAAFGLVHGFGFAGALAEIGLPQARAALALGAFNVGVELGQIAIVACAWPLLAALRVRPWFAERAVPLLSGVVVAAGAAWFVDRVFS